MLMCDDLISLGEAAAMAIDAGLSEEALLTAVGSGAVDSRCVDGVQLVSRDDLARWRRTDGPAVERAQAGVLALFEAHRSRRDALRTSLAS